MKKIILFFFIFLIFPFFLNATDSSKIYKDGYENPLNVLESFLWNDKKGNKIGLSNKVNILNRNLNATVHPVSLDSSKIKIVLSKIKYEDKNKEIINFVFNEKNIDVISKHIARGLLLANKDQDIIFKFIDKKEREISQTQWIIFAQKDSLNLVFFQVHGCNNNEKKNTKKFMKKKKEFHKNHPSFSFVKKKSCNISKK